MRPIKLQTFPGHSHLAKLDLFRRSMPSPPIEHPALERPERPAVRRSEVFTEQILEEHLRLQLGRFL
jgi:hypothetical protein